MKTLSTTLTLLFIVFFCQAKENKKVIVLPFTVEFIGNNLGNYESQNFVIHSEALGVAYQKQLIYHLYILNKKEANKKLKLEILTESSIKDVIAETQKTMSDLQKMKTHEIQALLPNYIILRGHIQKDDYENLRNLAFLQSSMQPANNNIIGNLHSNNFTNNNTQINNNTLINNNNMLSNNMANGNMMLNPMLNIDNTTSYSLSIANPHGVKDAYTLKEVDLERSSRKLFKYFKSVY